MGERWEGPYKVKGFDEERGGYSLQEMDGRLLKDLSPIKHLKVVEKALDKEQAYEVERIVGHRGGVNDREYQIKWKNESGVTGGANYWNTHNKQHATT